MSKDYQLDLLGEVPQFEFEESNLTNQNMEISKILDLIASKVVKKLDSMSSKNKSLIPQVNK